MTRPFPPFTAPSAMSPSTAVGPGRGGVRDRDAGKAGMPPQRIGVADDNEDPARTRR